MAKTKAKSKAHTPTKPTREGHISEVHHFMLLVGGSVVQTGEGEHVGRQRRHMLCFRDDIF